MSGAFGVDTVSESSLAAQKALDRAEANQKNADKLKKFAQPESDGSDDEASLEQRLNKLREFLRKQRGAIRVTNIGFETGRPTLNLADDMRPDPSNPYNRPSIEALATIKPRAVSNNMATTEDMMRIYTDLEGLGVPTEQVQTVVIQAVLFCKDASSSVFLDPRGSFEWIGGAISADAVIAVLKKDASTLRRVCRLYAPVTWNYMLTHNAPPSDWAAMGFQHEDRFAAFDCFDYVENSAAVQPLEGLIRRPTPREKIAHDTHKDIALRAANRNQVFGNFSSGVTGGRNGPELTRNYGNSGLR
ncbi:Coat protein [Narcissus common latent virus]|uniref:Capsid protein n=1 Tax=Narcissus common latent virus TaxID=160844 RepID=Q0VZC7_9VIRU|nr:Coat protein [Narcissus common latent virus]CAJ43609.1 Coat protein [Narcissus common latent virus]